MGDQVHPVAGRPRPRFASQWCDAENGLMGQDLSSKDRKKLRKKAFTLPGQRKYPIPNKAHARNALARVAQHGTTAEQKKVIAAVRKRFPSIGRAEGKKT